MPKRRPLSRDEKFARREAFNQRAREGRLQLPAGIREMREALGLTQAEFASRFGLMRNQVIDMEKGRSNPTRETLEKIGKPFGLVLGFVPRDDETT